jgi:hypothetical protein
LQDFLEQRGSQANGAKNGCDPDFIAGAYPTLQVPLTLREPDLLHRQLV